MRTLARAATSSLILLGAALALVVAAVAAIGIGGTRAATGQGNELAGDELTTAVVTGQLARSMDAAYAAGLAAVQASVPAERSRLLGSLYTTLLPAVDARLFALDQLHAGDPPAEQADIARFGRQWAAVRARLSPADLPAAPTSALAAAYAPVRAHLGQLFRRELDDARTDHARADAGAVRAIGLIAGAAALGLALGAVFLARGIRRIRGSLEPSQDQAEFADTLQIAGDEDEAHGLLKRHLERTLPATSAVVLNRNNSADRLEAVTPLPAGSPLPGTLRGAEPRSCLAVRSGRTHRGHQVGDQVLANVGATLRNVLRVRDFAGRNGGEEFAVLLPDTSITEALEIAERVRAAVAEIALPGSDVSVTASIGVAVFPDHAGTPDRLERLADAALYLAKRQGRNRVELADPSPVPAVANGLAPLTEAAHRP